VASSPLPNPTLIDPMITIQLDLSDGALEAYESEVAAYNAANGTSLTNEQYGALKLGAAALQKKEQAIEARAAKMAATAKLLPDAMRVQLTEDIRALITTAVQAHTATLAGDEQTAFLAAVATVNA